MTSMTSVEEGSTHFPPMKNRSSWRIGVTVFSMVIAGPSLCLVTLSNLCERLEGRGSAGTPGTAGAHRLGRFPGGLLRAFGAAGDPLDR